MAAVQLPAAPDLRRVDLLSPNILSCGGVTLQGMRELLAYLGAGPGGPRHIIMTDLREVCGGV